MAKSLQEEAQKTKICYYYEKEIYNEIDTATLKCEGKIYTRAFGSLTAAMEEDTNRHFNNIQANS